MLPPYEVWLLDFLNLHRRVQGEFGVADGGARGAGWMFRDHLEILSAGAGDGVGVTIAPFGIYGESAGGDQVVQRGALLVQSDVAAFGLANAKEIIAHAGEANGLRGCSARIGAGHLLEIKVANAQQNASDNKNSRHALHRLIVSREAGMDKRFGGCGAFGNNTAYIDSSSWQSSDILCLTLFVSLPAYSCPSDILMIAAAALQDLLSVEKLREQELEEARVIQGAMLPSQPLHIGSVLISHEFQPVAEGGGDYLDYFELADGNIGLYVGDVPGKGLPAALFAALAVGTLRGVHKTGQSPSHVLSVLNERLHLRGIPGRHSALQYALFCPGTGEMRISSAGMPGSILIRDGKCRTLQVAGIPPGLFPDVSYDEDSIQVEHGDSLLFCSDGLTEARNAGDEEFGVEGLQRVCLANLNAAPLDLLEHVFSAIQTFSRNTRQWDDMTAAVFHYA